MSSFLRFSWISWCLKHLQNYSFLLCFLFLMAVEANCGLIASLPLPRFQVCRIPSTTANQPNTSWVEQLIWRSVSLVWVSLLGWQLCSSLINVDISWCRANSVAFLKRKWRLPTGFHVGKTHQVETHKNPKAVLNDGATRSQSSASISCNSRAFLLPFMHVHGPRFAAHSSRSHQKIHWNESENDTVINTRNSHGTGEHPSI